MRIYRGVALAEAFGGVLRTFHTFELVTAADAVGRLRDGAAGDVAGVAVIARLEPDKSLDEALGRVSAAVLAIDLKACGRNTSLRAVDAGSEADAAAGDARNIDAGGQQFSSHSWPRVGHVVSFEGAAVTGANVGEGVNGLPVGASEGLKDG